MKKGSFIFYDADLEGLDYISDVQAGKLFKAIKNYRVKNDSSFVSKNSAVNILYGQIIGHISLNEEKYKALCEKRTQAINKRWGNDKMKASSEYKCIQKNSNEYLNDNENDNENENDNDNDIDNDNMNDNVNVNDACGAKKENKQIYYCKEKESPFYDSAPTIDTELMKQRVLERYRNMMNQS